VEALQIDFIGRIMSSCSGIDGPNVSQEEAVDVDVHVPGTQEEVEEAWMAWLARVPRCIRAGTDESQEAVDVEVHVPGTQEEVEEAWMAWLARAPRCIRAGTVLRGARFIWVALLKLCLQSSALEFDDGLNGAAWLASTSSGLHQRRLACINVASGVWS